MNPRRWGSGRTALVGLGLALVLAVALVVFLSGSDAQAGDADASATPDDGATSESQEAADSGGGTATVEVRDLVRVDTLEGDIGFGDARDVAAGRDGVVTATPDVGAVVGQGQILLAVDTEPTVLLVGDVPAYRVLDVDASDGPDVRQLEQALVDLGYGDGVTVDEDFTEATSDAVTTWEEALGRSDPDGRVELGDVVFTSGSLRVEEILTGLGSSVQGTTTVLTVTSPDRVVELDVSPSVADRLEVGTAAGLTLPDGAEVTGSVATIAGLAETDPETGEEVIAVTVTPDDPSTVAGWDSGTVEVEVERSRTEQATAVPVEALLALAEGGYAVEVVAEDGTTSLVAVEVGAIADDWAEVTGPAVDDGTVTAGTTVVVAA